MGRLLVAFVLLSAPLTLPACAQGGAKLAECQKLVDAVSAEDKKLAGPDPSDAAAMQELAKKLDEASVAVGAVFVTVPELVAQRDAIQKSWSAAAAAVRLAVLAAEKADPLRATQAQEDSATAGRRYTDAVAEVNRFCHE